MSTGKKLRISDSTSIPLPSPLTHTHTPWRPGLRQSPKGRREIPWGSRGTEKPRVQRWAKPDLEQSARGN